MCYANLLSAVSRNSKFGKQNKYLRWPSGHSIRLLTLLGDLKHIVQITPDNTSSLVWCLSNCCGLQFSANISAEEMRRESVSAVN